MKRIIPLFLILNFLLCCHNASFGQAEDSLKTAIKSYTQKIKKNPKDDNAYLKRADCEFYLSSYKFNSGQSVFAMNDYAKAIELNPKNYTAYNNRGMCKRMSGNDSIAIEDFTMAIKLNPLYAEAYFNRGFCFYIFRNLKEAIADFDKAIELNPTNSSAYSFRAYSKFFQGGYVDEPCSDWKKASDLGDSVALENLDKYCH